MDVFDNLKNNSFRAAHDINEWKKAAYSSNYFFNQKKYTKQDSKSYSLWLYNTNKTYHERSCNYHFFIDNNFNEEYLYRNICSIICEDLLMQIAFIHQLSTKFGFINFEEIQEQYFGEENFKFITLDKKIRTVSVSDFLLPNRENIYVISHKEDIENTIHQILKYR